MPARDSARYPLRGRVQLALPDASVLSGHAVDISIGGLCAVLDEPIALGCTYLVRFEMDINGQIHVVTAQAQAVYGVFASQGGFRVGLAFKQDDRQRTALIALLAGKRAKVSTKEAEPGVAAAAPAAPAAATATAPAAAAAAE